MALYALGDLHLSFQANKPMDAFGKVWKHHERKIEKYVNQIVGPEDTLVLTGDHSWGRKLSECREDLAFIERLPGRKILLRGNHDMFWDVGKTKRLNEEFAGKMFFLQNNFAVYQDYALVGTKGYTFEGPFYLDRRGMVIGWEEEREEHRAAALTLLEWARERLPHLDMLLLDESLYALRAGLLERAEVEALLEEARAASCHLVLSGRDAPQWLMDMADLVTEMGEIKHPAQSGVSAQRGIEF